MPNRNLFTPLPCDQPNRRSHRQVFYVLLAVLLVCTMWVFNN